MASEDTVERLSNLLLETEKAHHEYEQSQLGGQLDRQWADWYAQFAIDNGIGDLLGQHLRPRQLSASFDRATQAHESEGPELKWAEFTARWLAGGRS